MDALSISLPLAFLAGLVSFLSPCVLALVPSYLSLVTGLTLDELQAGGSAGARRQAALHAALFALGFGAVFVTLGAAATGFGQGLNRALPVIGRIGGVIIVLFGLHLLGIFRAAILDRERRLSVATRSAGRFGSLLAGVAFAAGWTPCVGPILASILLYSSFEATVGQGVLLLGVYTLGLAVPFMAAAVGFNWFLAGARRMRRWAAPLQRGAGAVLVVVGLLMVAGRPPGGAAPAGTAARAGDAAVDAEPRSGKAGTSESTGAPTTAPPGTAAHGAATDAALEGAAGSLAGAPGAGVGSSAGGSAASAPAPAALPQSSPKGSLPVPGGAQAPATAAPPPRAEPAGAPGAGQAETTRERPAEDEVVDLRGIGYNIGSAAAPVVVVEFSDFGCPYCRKFALETFPALYEEFIRTGKVRWKYVPFTLGIFPNGAEAARAAECAGEQDRFLPMHDLLYRNQAEWKGSRDADALFASYAQQIGLASAQFESCYRSGRRDARTRAANAAARQLGIRGTPTFFVEGFPVTGAVPLEPFRQFLLAVLEEKGRTR